VQAHIAASAIDCGVSSDGSSLTAARRTHKTAFPIISSLRAVSDSLFASNGGQKSREQNIPKYKVRMIEFSVQN